MNILEPNLSQLYYGIEKFHTMYKELNLKTDDIETLKIVRNYGLLILKHTFENKLYNKVHALHTIIIDKG